jgi:hypothetical protein
MRARANLRCVAPCILRWLHSLRSLRSLYVSLALAGPIVACSASATTSTNTNSFSDPALNGAWTSRSSGVALALTLAWTSDSVSGTGTYLVLDNALKCGGETLRNQGTVRLAASRSGSTLSGRMTFDNGWNPAYSGSLENNKQIVGAFQSGTAQSCPYPLYFGFVP